jgi:hypothetical protein
VSAGADTGPGREISSGAEPSHVGAGLGDDHIDREAIEARDREQRLVDGIERGGSRVDLLGQRPDRVVKEIEVSEEPTACDSVVGAEVPGQRFEEPGIFGRSLPLASAASFAGSFSPAISEFAGLSWPQCDRWELQATSQQLSCVGS